MANKNYQRGRRFEWELKKKLETDGWIVFRTAGSHGFADLIAIGPTGATRLIQCKVLSNEKHVAKTTKDYLNNIPFKSLYWHQLVIKIKGNKDYIYIEPE